MPFDTLQYLMEGKPEILEYYKNAYKLWEDIYRNENWEDTIEFSEILFHRQHEFERNCGNRQPGKEIMAVSGFAFLYDSAHGFSGNLEKAKNLLTAFKNSSCSIEIKQTVNLMAKIYNLK